MKKILFFKIGAIGDVLMTTPLVRAVKARYPDAQLDYWVGKSCKDVLSLSPIIHSVRTFQESFFYKKNIIQLIKLSRQVRKERYDCAFVLDKHWLFSFFIAQTKIPVRVGFLRDGFSFNTMNVAYKEKGHEIDYYLALGREIGAANELRTIDTVLSVQDNEFGKNYVRGEYTCVVNSGGANAGERGNIRRMPGALFYELVKRLSQRQKVVLIGGQLDNEYYSGFYFNNNVIVAAGKCSIRQSAAIMKYARRVYTTDCGPLHLASAVNDNIVAIFGPTDPARKGPLNAKSQTLWRDASIYNEAYELYGKQPKGEFFKNVTVDDFI